MVGGGGHGGGGGVGGDGEVAVVDVARFGCCILLFCTFTPPPEGEAFDWSICLKCWSAVDLPRHTA